MQIILLSGGSGTRLWPLSNKARSKQFLKLLPAPDGGRESMLQRVARQLRESGLHDAQINVATSIIQHDAIINQLGGSVNVITEPERRDTFPAIALACTYLASEKHCPEDETVVVMPCDPFTEAGYFRIIAQMAQAVESNAAQLVLMGIEPTYPSSKYGYIVPVRDKDSLTSGAAASAGASAEKCSAGIPCAGTAGADASFVNYGACSVAPAGAAPASLEDCAPKTCSPESRLPQGAPVPSIGAQSAISQGVSLPHCTPATVAASECRLSQGAAPAHRFPEVPVPLRVSRFTEKPSEQKAAELIDQGAFWNGGVFAFRLGHLTDIVRRYLGDLSFSELHARYSELPKISFDYEVVEKASSVAVVPFAGKWTDLGTWNTLTEELPDCSVGNVTMASSSGTHAVNELELPLMCIGADNLIIAASPDGILVADKAQSEHIKTYADKLQLRPMYEERRWGEYKVIDELHFVDGSSSLTLQLHIDAGKSLSYQQHDQRDEMWTILDGRAIVVLDGERTEVSRGDVLHINRGVRHAVKALTDLRLIEVQLGTSRQQDDVVRFPFEW